MKYQLQQKIQDILDQCIDMTVATIRPDGAPQATVVSFVHDGLVIYFVCGASSQKAKNIAHDPRVAMTVTPPNKSWNDIEGLSIAATAEIVTDAKEMSEIGRHVQQRFPQIDQMDPVAADEIKFIRLRPLHVSVLDYSKGFGHTDLVTIGADDIAVSSQSMRHRWLMPTTTSKSRFAKPGDTSSPSFLFRSDNDVGCGCLSLPSWRCFIGDAWRYTTRHRNSD